MEAELSADIEQACIQLLKQGKRSVKAGEIRSNMSDPIPASKLGMYLRLDLPDYDEIAVKTKPGSGSDSNTYRLSWCK